jgi:lipid A 3-O-deacylase
MERARESQRRRQLSRWLCRHLCLLGLLLLVPARAADFDSGRWTLIEDNDGEFSSQDRHYTQGLQLSYLSSRLTPTSVIGRGADRLGALLPGFRASAGSTRRFDIAIGQQIFTPEDIHQVPPDSNDRPYAGWLYAGFSLLQQNHNNHLNDLQVQFGVVGPAALGEQAQNGFHSLAGLRPADGWDSQLRNRGAIQLAYVYRRKIPLQLMHNYAFDAVPEAGFNIGSVLRYTEIGGLLRFGNALAANYGPAHVQPGLSGSDWFDADALGGSFLHWSIFAGGQLRSVYYNRLIDGAREVVPDARIKARPFTFDAVAGGGLVLSPRVHLSLTATRRTGEFRGQKGFDLFGTALLSVAF